MNPCRELKDKIIDLFENNLSDHERKQLFEHVKHCSACQKEFKKMQALYGVLDEDTVPMPDQAVFERIKDNIRQREIGLSIIHKIPKLIKVLVPALAIALFLIHVLRPEKTVEISIPTSVLLQDETIARISLGGIVNDRLIEDLIIIEEDLPIEIDEILAELSDDERFEFIEILYEELNRLQEDV